MINNVIRSFLQLISFVCMSSVMAQNEKLCVGHHWTEQEALIMMEKFKGQWNDLESWERRADVIRDGIISGMGLDQMPVISGQFNPIIHSTREMDGYIVENIAIESFPGFYITGNIYRPLVMETEKVPAILCTHGHKSNRGSTENLQLRCASLARMGAIVISYNMLGRGTTQDVSHTMPISLLLQTWNSKRILEYMLTRPDVDPDRIGMTGESGGATMTFLLAALDERVKLTVPVAQISAHFFGGCRAESGMPIHKSSNHQTNNVEIAALTAPRPMLIVSDGADWTINTPIVEYPYIQKVYEVYKVPYRVKNVHLPLEKHDYGYSKRAAAYIFLANHLGLNLDALPYDDGFLEDFVTILPNEDISVFNDDHPLPEKALVGDEAIMEYLQIDLKKIYLFR